MWRKLVLGGLAAAVALGAAGCGSSGSDAEDEPVATATTAPPIRPMGLEVTPGTDLRDGDVVTVSGFDTSAMVPEISQCLAPTADYPGGRCDEATPPVDVVDDAVTSAEFTVRRSITVDGKPVDCAAKANTCVIRFSVGVSDGPKPMVGLTFAAEAPDASGTN